MQKSALRCILGDSYISYEDALKKLRLVTLEERREQMSLKFAKQCLKIEKMKQLFPKNESQHLMEKRSPEFYKVVRIQTERFRKSEAKKQKQFKKLSSIRQCTTSELCL